MNSLFIFFFSFSLSLFPFLSCQISEPQMIFFCEIPSFFGFRRKREKKVSGSPSSSGDVQIRGSSVGKTWEGNRPLLNRMVSDYRRDGTRFLFPVEVCVVYAGSYHIRRCRPPPSPHHHFRLLLFRLHAVKVKAGSCMRRASSEGW